MTNDFPESGVSPFEAIRRTDEDGAEFWSARELAKLLEYVKWDKFTKVLEKAMCLCELAQQDIQEKFDPSH